MSESGIYSSSDTVTILQAVGPWMTLTKRVSRGKDGKLKIRSSPPPLTFLIRGLPPQNIYELSETLRFLEDKPDGCIIRGTPFSHVHLDEPVYRRMYPAGGHRAYFQESPRPWLCLDIDGWGLPKGYDVVKHPRKAIRWATNQLPKPFRGVTCHYQLSSSAGFAGLCELRCHLWYWLDRPVSDYDLKRYFGTNQSNRYPIDTALFNPVQIYYTADPILTGVKDPFQRRRSGLFPRRNDTVKFPEIPDHAAPTSDIPLSHHPNTGLGFEGHLDRIGVDRDGFHVPIRDAIASLAATPGRRVSWERAKQQIRDATQAAIRRAGHGERDENYIDRKLSDDYLDKEWETCKSKFGRGRLLTDVPPHYDHPTVSVKTARSMLRKEIWDWFKTGHGDKALFVTSGIGKSQEALHAIKRHIKDNPKAVVWHLVPTLELCEELAERYGDGAVVIRGRDSEHNGVKICQKADIVKKAAECGYNIIQSFCHAKNEDGEIIQCEYRRDCPYFAQFKQKANVFFMAHDYAFIRQRKSARPPDPDFIIIDERIDDKFLHFEESITTSEFIEFTKGGRIARIILEELREDRSPVLRLGRERCTSFGLRFMGVLFRYRYERKITPAMATKEIERILSDARKSCVSHIYLHLAKEIGLAESRSRKQLRSVDLIRTQGGEEKILCQWRRELGLPKNVPCLALDATGSERLIERVFPEIDTKSIHAKRNLRVVQTVGYRGSKSHFTTDKHLEKHLADIHSLIKTLSTRHRTGLIVTHKDIEDAIEAPTDWVICHFGALRGLDQWKDLECVVAVGRMQPNPQQIQRQAKTLLYDSEEPLMLLPDNQNYPLTPRGYKMARDGQYGVMTPVHPDTICQILLEQTRENEIVQAVDRIRAVNARKMKAAYILCEIPVDLPVDLLMDWHDLNSRLTQALIRSGGVLPLSPKWLVEQHPDLWKTKHSAEMDVRRMDLNRQTPIYSLLGFDGFKQAIHVYKYRMPRQRRYARCLSLFGSHETRRRLEGLVGEITAFVANVHRKR